MPSDWSITLPVYHRPHLFLLRELPVSSGMCIFAWRLPLMHIVLLCKMSGKLQNEYFLSRVATVLLQGG